MMTESKGVPSVSVITSTFTRAAHARATALGMPGVRIVVTHLPNAVDGLLVRVAEGPGA